MNDPATPASAVTGLAPGARLREERERQGITVARAAEQLRLEVGVLEAIEADSYACLGAPVYARGHLRKYGALLGVAGEELVAAYDRLSSGPAAPTLIPAASAHEYSRPRPWLLPLATLVVAVLVAGSFWWWLGRQTPLAEPAAAAPAAVAATDTGGAGAAGPTDGENSPGPAPAAAGPAPAAVDETAPTTASPPGPSTAPVTGAATAASTAMPVAGSVMPAAAPTGSAPLSIALSSPCWIEIYDASGRRVAFEMAPAGATRRFEGGPWKVLLGNAAAARLSLDGRTLPVPPEFAARNVAWVEVTVAGAIRKAASTAPVPPEN